MNARSSFATVKQLIRDTFRQACASGICWMMLAVTAICVLLCLSVNVSGDVPLHGEDEPVLFLPPPAHRAPSPRRAAVSSEGYVTPSKPILSWLDARESKRSAAA